MSNQDKMSDLDKAIHQSLSQEDQDFLARLDEEPHFYKQVTGIYKGSLGSFNWMATIGFIFFLVVGIFALIRFFNTSPDIEGMLKWGGLTAFCVGVMFLFRLWFAMHLQTNRVLRELKKLELQIASLKQNRS
jgi:hypothetical protein